MQFVTVPMEEIMLQQVEERVKVLREERRVNKYYAPPIKRTDYIRELIRNDLRRVEEEAKNKKPKHKKR